MRERSSLFNSPIRFRKLFNCNCEMMKREGGPRRKNQCNVLTERCKWLENLKKYLYLLKKFEFHILIISMNSNVGSLEYYQM